MDCIFSYNINFADQIRELQTLEINQNIIKFMLRSF